MMNFTEIEKKWKTYWEKNKTFETDVWDFSKPKYYVLDMFPYPSGHGLHVGHPEGYTATDIVARMKRMQGYNVLHPMGYDSFGLPAEQYAIKTGNNPDGFTQKNIQTFEGQLKMLGFSFDWSKQIATSDPSFFKWTQWIFKRLYEAGFARNVDTAVNWCEELGTVLANDEIINGKSERGGYPVVRKIMKQWIIDTPKYVERLLNQLDDLDWPESTKEMQRNWFGKSIGAEVVFGVKDHQKTFTVFTTRPDTLFGATYCVLSPEHELVNKIVSKEQEKLVQDYQAQTARKSELERTDLNKDKTGVFLGAYAINPVNNVEIPIYISDYVLSSYGTGAIMAVPAHDTRDYEFAKKFDIKIIPVLEGVNLEKEAHTEDGLHINSEFLNGLNKEDAIATIIAWLEEHKCGKKTINYKLREWIFARQRYWGEPIPVIYLENGETYLVPDASLPLLLPQIDDYRPSKDGQSPLAKATSWVNVEIDGVKGKRETSTMPGSAGSSWYWMRYIDPKNDTAFADPKLLKHWLPVDLYVGGSEHAVGHLIYSRFFNNFLYDQGLVPVKEPFARLAHPGMILGENNEKMSKSRGNVVNPDDVVAKVGADTLRLYEMFMGPLKDPKPWNSENIGGAKRFLDRVWRLYVDDNKIADKPNKNLEKVYHETVKKVTEDYDTLSFNTAISQMMIFINAVYKEQNFPREYAEGFLKLLNPIAPFMTEELWAEALHHSQTIAYEPWPVFDETKLVEDTFICVVQVNGKLKGKLQLPSSATKEDVLKAVGKDENLSEQISAYKKVIYVPGRIVNFIV